MTDDAPCRKGGQGVVTIGTLGLPETVKRFSFALKAAAERLGVSPEELIRRLPKLRWEIKLWPPQLTVDAAVEMLGMSLKALKEWLPEARVAVKSLVWNRDDAEESTKFFKSFTHELSLMAELTHPNVVRLVGFVEDMEKGRAWMILPWESNGNVREFLQSWEWDIPERISLIQDTASGLEYLHSRQPPICHGDLKSLNVLVNSSYRAVITDFGSARIRRNVASGERENPRINNGGAAGWTSPEVKFDPSTQELTLTGPMFSLRWTAPEVLADEEQDLPSDMWAIGWICWEIVTGKIPFEDLNTENTIVKHTIEGKMPAVRENIDLSHVLKLCGLMTECWVLEPVKRIDASAFQRRARIMPSETPSGSASDGQKTRSARLLTELGQMYTLQNDHLQAMSYYQSALKVATQTRDDAAKAFALDHLAQLYVMQSMHREAEQATMEAYNIYSHGGNIEGVARTLSRLGQVYQAQSKIREAEKMLLEANEIHSRMGNTLGAAQVLNDLGHIYAARWMSQDAEKALTMAHEMHSCVGDDLGAAKALDGLGQIYRAQSKHGEAEKAFMEAHEMYTRIGDHVGAANALNGLGQIYRAQSKHGEAEKAFTEAHEIHSRIANHGLGENRRTGEGSTTSGALVQDPSTRDMDLTNSDIHPGNQNDIPLSISPSSRLGSLLMESLAAGTQPSATASTSSDAIAEFVYLGDSLPSSNVDSRSYRIIPPSFTPFPRSDSTMGPTSHARSAAADVLGTRWQPGDLIEFNGDERECERFVLLIREAARHHGKLDDPMWVAAFASTCLTGDALRWHNGIDGDTRNSWELLAPALLNKFSSPSLDDQLEAKPGSAGWRSSIPISSDGSLPRRPPEESGSAKPCSPTLKKLSPTSAAVWPPELPEQPIQQPKDSSPNSGSLVESSVPQEIDLIQELASIEINSTASTKDIADLILVIGRAIPKAIRNKHQLYRLLIRSRDLCNHLHLMLHSEIGSSANFDVFKQCWEIMDRLERALLDLANLVSEEMVPLGESSLANWGNSCQKLRQLSNELTALRFDACDTSDSVYAERDRYFDDCSWSSLVLVAGIEVPAQTMYLSEGGIPFEAQHVLDRLDYLVNEMRLNGNIDERTRELVIIIISDTARVVMKGPMEASLDFWNQATVALQAIDPENRLNPRMAETLQNSWSRFVDRQVQALLPPRSPSPAISRYDWMKFHNFAVQNGITWNVTEVAQQLPNGGVVWVVSLSVTQGAFTSSFTGGPALKKIEAKNLAARLALTALGASTRWTA